MCHLKWIESGVESVEGKPLMFSSKSRSIKESNEDCVSQHSMEQIDKVSLNKCLNDDMTNH